MSDIKLACDMAEQIKTICDKHGNKPGELINILHEAQHLQMFILHWIMTWMYFLL